MTFPFEDNPGRYKNNSFAFILSFGMSAKYANGTRRQNVRINYPLVQKVTNCRASGYSYSHVMARTAIDFGYLLRESSTTEAYRRQFMIFNG